MIGRICTHCGARLFPLRLVCPSCHNEVTSLAQRIFPSLNLQAPPSAEESELLATVIIPSYNSATTIRATLSSVMTQDFKGAYEVISCFNYLQRSLIPQIKGGIVPGGVVVYETFIVDQAQFGHPHNPDFLLKYNELLEMFDDFRCLRYREGIIGDKAIASIIARKVQGGG